MRKNFKKNVQKKIRNFVFGVRAKGEKVNSLSTKGWTVYPKERPNFFDWAKEYRVGCAHKNKPIHF